MRAYKVKNNLNSLKDFSWISRILFSLKSLKGKEKKVILFSDNSEQFFAEKEWNIVLVYLKPCPWIVIPKKSLCSWQTVENLVREIQDHKGELPVPKFIKGLRDWALMYTLFKLRYMKKWTPSPERWHKKIVLLPSLVMFHCVVTRLWHVKGRPNSTQMSLILRWRPPNPIFESLLDGCNLTTEPQTW